MAYTTNPHLPRVRIEAVGLVHKGWRKRKVARHLGFFTVRKASLNPYLEFVIWSLVLNNHLNDYFLIRCGFLSADPKIK